MNGAVFRKTLFDARWGILGWGLGLAALAFLVIAFYPTIAEMKEINDIISGLPPVLKAMVGDIEDFASPEGFLATKLFSMLPIVLGVYGILAGVAAVAGEENRGTMDLLMSTPVPRWRVILEKFAAFVVSVLLILAIMYAGILIGALLTPEIDTPPGRLLEATMNLAPITLCFGSLTFFLSAGLRGRTSAGVVAAVVVVASYTLYLFAEMSEALASVVKLTPFYYYGSRTLLDGLAWINVSVFLAVSLMFMGLSVASFERRDLSV